MAFSINVSNVFYAVLAQSGITFLSKKESITDIFKSVHGFA